jgi:hypothetical protein
MATNEPTEGQEGQGTNGPNGAKKSWLKNPKNQLIAGVGAVGLVLFMRSRSKSSSATTASGSTTMPAAVYDSSGQDVYSNLEPQIAMLQQDLLSLLSQGSPTSTQPNQPAPTPGGGATTGAPQPGPVAPGGITQYAPPVGSGAAQAASGTEQIGNGQSTYLAATSPQGGLTEASPVSLAYGGQALPGGADYMPGTVVTGYNNGVYTVNTPPINPIAGVVST